MDLLLDLLLELLLLLLLYVRISAPPYIYMIRCVQ